MFSFRKKVDRLRCLAFDDLKQDDDKDYDAFRIKLEDARQDLLFWFRKEQDKKRRSPEYTKALKNFREAWYDVFKTNIPVNSEERYLKALQNRSFTNNSPLKRRGV